MTQDDKARQICCRLCHAGVGEKCFNMKKVRSRLGFSSLRIKTVHQVRIEDTKARGI